METEGKTFCVKVSDRSPGFFQIVANIVVCSIISGFIIGVGALVFLINRIRRIARQKREGKMNKILKTIGNILFAFGMYVFFAVVLIIGSIIEFLFPLKISGKFLECFFSPIRLLFWVIEKIEEKHEVRASC